MKQFFKGRKKVIYLIMLFLFTANTLLIGQNQGCTVRGTVFPFVNIGYEPFDELFEVKAELYAVPSGSATDSIAAILQGTGTPLYSSIAENYDGSIFVPGTPKNPGSIGSTNNPGLPLNWSSIGKTQGIVDNTLLTSTDNIPSTPIGLYTFNNVVPGDYILVLSRAGYMKRFAKITVNNNGILGHRELLAGDINNDMQVSVTDMSLLNANFSFYGDSTYNTRYDLNADGMVNSSDTELLLFYLRATSISIYQDTYEWLMSY